MAVEIGSLVVRGTFGSGDNDSSGEIADLRDQMRRLRQEMQEEMREMIAEFDRRRADR